MNVQDCIRNRKSSRKFSSREIDCGIIREVTEDSLRAPSYRNSQPWEVAVITGEKKKELSRLLNDLLDSNTKPEPDIPEPVSWPDHIQMRISDTAQKRSQAFGISKNDPEAAKKSKQANYGFYGAPAVLFFYQDASLGMWSILDMGMFIENVLLGFHGRGIATVPQAFLVDYSPQIKKFLNIPESKKLILGVSAGYADENDIRSKFISPRSNVEDILRWYK